MASSSSGFVHLTELLEAARDEADRIGPGGEFLSRRIADFLQEVRGMASTGRPDEGLRPDELTAENDE